VILEEDNDEEEDELEKVAVEEEEKLFDEDNEELDEEEKELKDEDEEDGTGAAHVVLAVTPESTVTAPFRANMRPSTFAPVLSVTDVKAKIFPLKIELVPRVAELVTCHRTLQGWAPLMRTTELLLAVMSVEEDCRIQTALGSPWASSVRVPVT